MKKELEIKAEQLLGKCDVLSLASINESGFPRACVMAKMKANGIMEIWFSTGTSSKKTIHFLKNSKASACFYVGGDSVTLVGNIEIVDDVEIKRELWQDWFIKHFPGGINDPEYCILKFSTTEATIYIDDQFETFTY